MWRDDRAVATTEGDIAEVLEAVTLVDMQKLRELSTHGIPNNLRAEAWKYLLGVARPEKDEEMSLHRQNIEEYRELHWEGSFEDYLELVRQDPNIARTAYQRVYDMVDVLKLGGI